MLAFRLMRCAIRGDLIWLKSMPPGVYVNGFLSLVIMAFCTHDGISGGCCVWMRRVGIAPFISGGGGGAELFIVFQNDEEKVHNQRKIQIPIKSAYNAMEISKRCHCYIFFFSHSHINLRCYKIYDKYTSVYDAINGRKKTLHLRFFPHFVSVLHSASDLRAHAVVFIQRNAFLIHTPIENKQRAVALFLID